MIEDGQRCASCAFWREHGAGVGRGECLRVGQVGRSQDVKPSPLAAIRSASGGAAGLVTGSAFGCLEHEPREKWGPR